MHLAVQALVYRHATETKETSISDKRNIVQNPKLAGGRPVGYLQRVTEDYRETNPPSGRVKALNPQMF